MISAAAFTCIRDLVRRASGVVVDPCKEYLAESRLGPLLAGEGLTDLDQLSDVLRCRRWSDLHRRVVEAMLTTETSFFRDRTPFEALRSTILPELRTRRAGARRLRICSAASSSGQEAYSLAMLLREDFPDIVSRWDVEILGIDLNEAMVARARQGVFNLLEVNRGLPARYLTRYFQCEGRHWQIRPEVRDMVRFTRMNLLEELPARIDVLFMRNVLMYFGPDTRSRVLERAREALREDGVLFVGGTETLVGYRSFVRRSLGNSSCYTPRPRG